MRNKINRILCLVIFNLLLLVCSSYSKDFFVSKNDSSTQIGHKLKIYLDKDKNKNSEFHITNAVNYISNNSIKSLGIFDGDIWLRYDYKKLNTKSKKDLILRINQPLLEEITFYRYYNGKLITTSSYSNNTSFYNRKYPQPSYAFDLSELHDSGEVFLLKLNSNMPVVTDVQLLEKEAYYKYEIRNELFLGLYIGIIFAIALYNLFIFFTVLDKSYMVYVLYIIFVGLTQISLQGYGYKYFWPNWPVLNNYSTIILSSLGALLAMEFTKVFLKTKIHLPFHHKASYVIESIFVLAIFIVFFGYSLLSILLVQITTLLLSFYILYIVIKILYLGYRPALFFLIAWAILLLAAFIFILKDFGILPYNSLTVYAMQIGSAIEVILLSFALADRIKILQREKDDSQRKVLDALRENERIIKEQNIILEAKVEERTYALQKSNTDLSTTLSELKQTQSQLVNAEKMASLGQLTAGIAHEINNPINFVLSNVKPLRRDIEDIQEIITKYDHILPEEQKGAIDKYKKEIDYQYVQEEINTLLNGIEEGAKRTSDIIKGLRVFSRLDENDLKRADLIEGIESTLSLLNTELSNKVTVVKNYKQIPPVECFPGKLNQVFMNILNNAIYAIKAHTERKEKGLLTIDTLSDNLNVYIKITDNGTGMTDDVKAKLFEPFFTTKDVGKGTGLGLSICYSIIQDHKGTIKVDTEYGKGTTFIITLPINQV